MTFTLRVGGKDWLAPYVAEMAAVVNFDRYVEPFVGGGAVFFEFAARGLLDEREAFLSDADPALIAVYDRLWRGATSLWLEAETHLAKIRDSADPKTAYFALRDAWNTAVVGQLVSPHRWRELAPITFVLQRTSFNGLWRLNRRGGMNVPPRDGLDGIELPTKAELTEYADLMRRCRRLKLATNDFRQLRITPRDFVYLDPPYAQVNATSFVGYTAAGFQHEDQVALIDLCGQWSQVGATVAYSNADTPEIRQALTAWRSGHVLEVAGRRSIACNGDRRKAPELLVVASPLLTELKSSVFLQGRSERKFNDRQRPAVRCSRPSRLQSPRLS